MLGVVDGCVHALSLRFATSRSLGDGYQSDVRSWLSRRFEVFRTDDPIYCDPTQSVAARAEVRGQVSVGGQTDEVAGGVVGAG
jgi:hypothetical protein